jgi:transcriptional regulator with XRE-family HTH domain
MIGKRLRQARASQKLSLNEVAERADISVATLSRIERDKQNIAVDLFLTLCEVLKTQPNEMIGEATSGVEQTPASPVDELIRKISGMDVSERTRFWHGLSKAQVTRTRGRRGSEVRVLAREVEELVAQAECLREQLESVRKKLKRSS